MKVKKSVLFTLMSGAIGGIIFCLFYYIAGFKLERSFFNGFMFFLFLSTVLVFSIVGYAFYSDME